MFDKKSNHQYIDIVEAILYSKRVKIHQGHFENQENFMIQIRYPAIFTPETQGRYSVRFPDIEGCYTCGDTLEEGYEMAKDTLALILYDYQMANRELPIPSKIELLQLEQDEFIEYIAFDML